MSNFSKHKDMADGHLNFCKKCKSQYYKNYSVTHKEELSQRAKNYYKAHRAYILDRVGKWQKANNEVHNQNTRKYYSRHKVEIKRRSQSRVHKNRYKRYSWRERDYPDHFTWNQWVAQCTQYGNHCLRCRQGGSPDTLTPDHILPLAKGGDNNIDNIQPLCLSCNRIKHIRYRDYR